ARTIAAHLLEAAEADLEFEAGRFSVKGLTERAVTLTEVARTAHRGARIPAGMEPGLEATRVYDPPDFTIPFGVYIAVVEVLRETGAVKPLGAKGVGEAGCVGAPQAVVNAVCDALAGFGVIHVDMPLRPEKLWALMREDPLA